MKWKIIGVALCAFMASHGVSAQMSAKPQQTETEKAKKYMSIYDFKVEKLDGKPFDFATLKGKKIMIVNTASECGLTPQYEKLQALYEKYGGKDFVIIGFPANNFGSQEPGTNQEIGAFCKQNYGVTFPMMAKISVGGKDIAPIYDYLTDGKRNGLKSFDIEWNFEKILIDQKGRISKVISPKTAPDDKEIVDWIKS